MFYVALQRPLNFEELSSEEQWGIDKELGILDWDGPKDATERQQYMTRCGRFRVCHG